MRHLKNTVKLGRTTSHRRCLMANMLKSLIEHERIETTVEKAKFIKRHADKIITLAKKNTLASRRQAIAAMMIRFNPLNSKEKRRAKEGDLSVLNGDRKVIQKLFETLGPRFHERLGGYTRMIRHRQRRGDNAKMCFIEFLAD